MKAEALELRVALAVFDAPRGWSVRELRLEEFFQVSALLSSEGFHREVLCTIQRRRRN